MDPSILKTTSESEEDQTVDRKVSAPLDPSTLHITERRRGDTRNSCFDLNIATIQALQAKADRAMGKDLFQGTKMNTKMKVIVRVNILMKARIEMITVEIMPMKMIVPHPSAFRQNICFQITRDRGQTRFAERVHLPSLLLSVR